MKRRYLVILILLLVTGLAEAQDPMRRIQGAGNRLGRPAGGASATGDSLEHRTGLEDSITIHFRFLDTTRLLKFDSSVHDFTKKFPVPWDHIHLGNFGTAAKSLLFSPMLKSGWDHGFHAFDIYNFTVDATRFYTTTRPYSEVGYMLGSQAEQMINLLHTQNILPNWNMSVQYRMINSPGFFQNQNANHNNYRISSWYQSRNKRYQNFVIILGNKLQSSENGGIMQDTNYLDIEAYEERSNIPTRIGPTSNLSRNLFSTNITTGSKFTNGTFLMRQQYDIGQKDSIVTDSVVIPLFYPRLRLEHNISYNTYNYRFNDENPDSAYYASIYKRNDSPAVFLQDRWKVLLNDFSIYQFPDAKNPQQFFKVGASLQNLSGVFDTGLVSKTYYNFFLHGEYRNKTRNQKWDIEASGNFYVNGLNAGDYDAYLSLKRLISRKIGSLQVGFRNINRSPSFTFNNESSFYLNTAPENFNKENIIHLFGALEQPATRLRLSGDYFLVNNYTFFRDYYKADQASALFNVLRISAEKQFRLGKKGWNWKTWVVLQQKAGDAPLNLPLLLTRNQIVYDGSLGFKNLLISLGLEMRYFLPYKGDGYSPVNGQFFYQDTTTIRMKVPEITGFMHFRIKGFTAYVRAENLNSLNIGGGGFTNNNVLVPGYPYPGLQIRLGIFWTFVN